MCRISYHNILSASRKKDFLTRKFFNVYTAFLHHICLFFFTLIIMQFVCFETLILFFELICKIFMSNDFPSRSIGALLANIIYNLVSFDNFRMVLVANPLHYKRLITKRRLHTAFLSISFFFFVNITCFYIFLRQEAFIFLKECVVQYVIHFIPYFTNIGFIYTCIIIMAVNCIIISIKLQKMSTVALGTKTGTQDNDHKLTQATWMALTLFLLFVVPITFLGVVAIFLQIPYPIYYDILLDLSYLLFYMNNVVNPFVYYIYLKTFKEGYQAMLCCKNKRRNRGNSSGSSATLSHSIQTISSQQ